MAEDRIVKFCARRPEKWWQTVPKWAWSRSRDVLSFWQISVSISKTVQDTDTFTMKI